MKDFSNYFKNPFDTPRISDNNLRMFAQDHLQRTKANNTTGAYTFIIEATEPLVEAFGNGISKKDIRSGVKKGKTLTATQIVQQFKKTVSRREGAVRDVFGEDSKEYLSFFPKGVTEFNRAKLSTIDTLMHRMETLTAQYTAELGAAIATEFADLRSKYEQSRTSQLQAFGTVRNLRTAATTTRKALVAQLCVNLLTIASHNVGHPDRLNGFMDQTLLRPKTRKGKEGRKA